MVNIGDILAQKQRDNKAVAEARERLMDPAILTLDVVETLRQEQELRGDDPTLIMGEEELRLHLKMNYEAQGIDISDAVLESGIQAFKDQTYDYKPPARGISRRLALIYIRRRKWLPLMLTLGFIFGAITAINYVGFVHPQKAEARRVETLIQTTLPNKIEKHHEHAVEIAATDDLRSQADQLRALGEDALDQKDIKTAERIAGELETFASDLKQAYQIRIVSRPGEYSGVFRINQDGQQEVRNYYLIVEGISADGERVNVQITSEEDQRTERTRMWGVRVSETVFNRVAADKRDDQIIQNAIIGEKKRGELTPTYSTETMGGLILDW